MLLAHAYTCGVRLTRHLTLRLVDVHCGDRRYAMLPRPPLIVHSAFNVACV